MDNTVLTNPTLGQQTLRALARHPSRTAFSWPGGSMTFRGTADMIGRMQRVIGQVGLPPGTRVALLAGNRAEAWCAAVAAQLCRLATTWLHPLGSLDDQLFQIRDSGADMLIVDAAAFHDRGGELAARAADISTVFTIGPADYGIDLERAMERSGHGSPVCLAEASDIASLNYTGGTTGRAKGAVRTHHEYGGFATAILADFEFPQTPRFLAAGPISHVTGTKILPVLMRGGTVHMLPAFDPDAVLACIARERINSALLVPTMIYRLLDNPSLSKTDVSSLELLLYGASAMAQSRLAEGIERIGPVFSQLFGQTECYPISVLRKSDHDLKNPTTLLSCGFPLASCNVKILDEAGQEVGPGETGEICVRATHAMREYWKQPDATAEALQGGWVHTGDIARTDDRGYLYIVDRKKDMIVSGGFNIYPREVEDVLSQHPDVAMAAVIGVPDDTWGEAVMAVVVARAGAKPAADDLISLVKARKGSAHAPKRVSFVNEIPTTALGKVDKKMLRASYWTGRDRLIG